MKGFNSVQMIGNIGQDIELRNTTGGTAVTTLRLAVNERAKVNGEWSDVTNWFDVVCWGKTAELCAQYQRQQLCCWKLRGRQGCGG